jgi:hypothetical protein
MVLKNVRISQMSSIKLPVLCQFFCDTHQFFEGFYSNSFQMAGAQGYQKKKIKYPPPKIPQ